MKIDRLIKVVKKDSENIDYIFLDIFDTIVTRSVDPEYIKKIWSMFVVNVFKLDIKPEDLYQKRSEIEKKLSDNALVAGHDSEFKHKYMIDLIHSFLVQEHKLPYQRDYFLRKCVQTEINIEKQQLFVRQDLFDLIKYFKKKNKKIILISDMYLSKKSITEILSNLDIVRFVDDIFVSSEYLISKRSGKLYKYILEKYNTRPEKCCMIGDNKNADYIAPLSLGIKPYLLDVSSQYNEYKKCRENSNEEEIFNKIKKVVKSKNNLPFVDTVYSLYMFIERLYFKLMEVDAEDVVFLSREGQFLQKLFEEYQKTIQYKKIKTHYMLVSRKSTYLPSLNKISNEDFSVLFKAYADISPTEFLRSIGFSNDEISEIQKKSIKKIEYDKKIINFSKSKEFANILNNRIFKQLYEKKRCDQKQQFKNYVEELGVGDKSKMYIVDVGWKGTIQNNIQKILGGSISVQGYYLGMNIIDKTNYDILKNKEGLLFSNYPEETNYFILFDENRPLFEMLLGASHGAAEYYIKDKTGVVSVRTGNNPREKDLFKKYISPIQKEIFLKFCQIKDILQNRIYDEKKVEKIFSKQHYKMVFVPSEKELMFFKKLYHFENFGLFSFTEFNKKNKLTIKQKIREYMNYFMEHNKYRKDYYWCQLKSYNNGLKGIMFMYAFEMYIRLKKRNIF